MYQSYKLASLNKEQKRVLIDKGTDKPIFDGRYQPKQFGTFLCRLCGKGLFRAEHQFTSSCGWPSFDDEVLGSIKKQADVDGQREEILCARCDGHLGHVFTGEYMTQKNMRHCVNATSIEFVPDKYRNHIRNKILDFLEPMSFDDSNKIINWDMNPYLSSNKAINSQDRLISYWQDIDLK